MESGTKALIMAGSVLLAILVISLLVFTFNRMGEWRETQDQELLIAQTDKFNNEFQAYDKDLMYGVDLISCLNKAKSINDQIEDQRKINGNTYDEEYRINIQFTLKKELSESISVYHKNEKGKEVVYSSENGPSIDTQNIENTFSMITSSYKSEIIKGIPIKNNLKTCSSETKMVAATYQLLKNNGSIDEKVNALLSCVNNLKPTVKNTSSSCSEQTSWTKAEWETALYDMKKRKFTCDSVQFNATTGQIKYMEFREY